MTPLPAGLSREQRAGAVVIVALVALAGIAGAAIVTRAGSGLDADSITYLDAAQNLAAGRGLALTPGLSVESNPLQRVPLTHHPPLFPAILAMFQTLGVDPLAGARWLNVLLFGVNALLVGLIVRRWTGSGALAILGALLVTASVDLFRAHLRNLIKENYWSDGRLDYAAMNHMVEGLQITGQMKGDVDWPKYVDTSYLPLDLRPTQ